MLGSTGFYLQLVVGYTAEATTETLEGRMSLPIFMPDHRAIIIPLVPITMMSSPKWKRSSLWANRRLGGRLGRHYNDRAVIGIIMVTIWFECRDLASGAGAGPRRGAGVTSDGRRSISQLLIASVPSNIFADMAESRATSIIAVAVFGMITASRLCW